MSFDTNIQYYLVFNNNETVRLEIDEPIGISEIVLKTERKIYAHKYSINNDEVTLTFTPREIKYGHQFEKLLHYYNTYGHESNVYLIERINGFDANKFELLFSTAKTNKINYIEFKCEVKSARLTVDNMMDIDVNVYSTRNINDTLNVPAVQQHNVLLQSKETLNTSVSTHNEANDYKDYYYNTEDNPDEAYKSWWLLFGHNRYSDINNTLTYESGNLEVPSYNMDEFIRAVAEDNYAVVYDIEVGGRIKIMIDATLSVHEVQDLEFAHFDMYIITGTSNSENPYEEWTPTLDVPPISYIVTGSRHQVLWNLTVANHTKIALFFTVQSENYYIRQQSFVRVINCSVTAEMVGFYPDSTVRMARLIDVGNKIIKSIDRNINVESPLFEVNEVFYNYFIANGMYIRGIERINNGITPYILTLKDWMDFIYTAFNCDVQFYDNTAFIGRHEEFYINNEIARFEFVPDIDSLEITYNEDEIINGFVFGYDKYDEDEKNTIDAYHTESKWLIGNLKAIKSKDIAIKMIADGYYIEKTRREGLDEDIPKSKKEDDDTYIVDAIPNNTDGYKNRRMEGFQDVQGVFSPETSYNLRMHIKRLMIDHWRYYISEMVMYVRYADQLFNTYFKANNKLVTKALAGSLTTSGYYIGDSTRENTFTTPLTYPNIWTFTLGVGRVPYDEAVRLLHLIMSKRGYITFYDAEKEYKMFPIEVEYDRKLQQLKGKFKQKYG